MKKILERFINVSILIASLSISAAQSMPSSDSDEDEESSQADSDSSSGTKSTPSAGAEKGSSANNPPPPKPIPLTWPETSEVSEDNKKLLLSNNKEIVQLFTRAQEVCKNMDDTLSGLNTLRDEANKKYRDTLTAFEPLLQRIGAAQAENKKS